MAFLNPPDVLPEAMRFLLRALLTADGTMAEDDLLRLVAPEGLVEALDDASAADGSDGEDAAAPGKFRPGGRIIADASLSAMRSANLVTAEGKVQSLVPDIRDRFATWKDVTPATFVELIWDTVLASVEGAELTDELPGGAEDLANALALLLCLPSPLEGIRSFDAKEGKSLAGHQRQLLGAEQTSWIVRNSERYLGLVRWTSYLGMGRTLDRGLVMDPSAALRKVAVPLVDRDLSIADFLDRLAPVMPSSDRGVAGSAVRRRIEASERELSPGLALGLLTLHGQKQLVLSNRSDAESFEFRLRPDHSQPYSHIAPGGAP